MKADLLEKGIAIAKEDTRLSFAEKNLPLYFC